MLQIDFLRRAPRRVRSLEEVFWADYFAFEESRECWMVVGQAWIEC
jgi:hypothetical protein